MTQPTDMINPSSRSLSVAIQRLHRKWSAEYGRHILLIRTPKDKPATFTLYIPTPVTEEQQHEAADLFDTVYKQQYDQLTTCTGVESLGAKARNTAVIAAMLEGVEQMAQTTLPEAFASEAYKAGLETPIIANPLVDGMISTMDRWENQKVDAIDVIFGEERISLNSFMREPTVDKLPEDVLERLTQAYTLGENGREKHIAKSVYVEFPDRRLAALMFVTPDIIESATGLYGPIVQQFTTIDSDVAFQHAADELFKVAEHMEKTKGTPPADDEWQLIAFPVSTAILPFLLQSKFYPEERPADLAILRDASFLLTNIQSEDNGDKPT